MPFALLATALAFSLPDAQLAYDRARALVEACTPRDAGTPGALRAAAWIEESLRAEGVHARRDIFMAKTPKGKRTFANVIAELPSKDPASGWIVLLSHFDTKANCPGANDGASTTGLLLALAGVVARRPPGCGNLLLVWTDGEECMEAYGPMDGFWGSKRAAERLSSSGRKVTAAICLDMLGDQDLGIIVPSNVTPDLSRRACRAAGRIGRPGLVRPVGGIVRDDHVAFLERGIPSLLLIDFCYGPDNAYWHTPQDTIDKVSVASLLTSGRLVVELLKDLWGHEAGSF